MKSTRYWLLAAFVSGVLLFTGDPAHGHCEAVAARVKAKNPQFFSSNTAFSSRESKDLIEALVACPGHIRASVAELNGVLREQIAAENISALIESGIRNDRMDVFQAVMDYEQDRSNILSRYSTRLKPLSEKEILDLLRGALIHGETATEATARDLMFRDANLIPVAYAETLLELEEGRLLLAKTGPLQVEEKEELTAYAKRFCRLPHGALSKDASAFTGDLELRLIGSTSSRKDAYAAVCDDWCVGLSNHLPFQEIGAMERPPTAKYRGTITIPDVGDFKNARARFPIAHIALVVSERPLLGLAQLAIVPGRVHVIADFPTTPEQGNRIYTRLPVGWIAQVEKMRRTLKECGSGYPFDDFSNDTELYVGPTVKDRLLALLKEKMCDVATVVVAHTTDGIMRFHDGSELPVCALVQYDSNCCPIVVVACDTLPFVSKRPGFQLATGRSITYDEAVEAVRIIVNASREGHPIGEASRQIQLRQMENYRRQVDADPKKTGQVIVGIVANGVLGYGSASALKVAQRALKRGSDVLFCHR